MPRICSNCFLLTTREDIKDKYKSIASLHDVILTVKKEWKDKYRINSEVIVCTSDKVEEINKEYYAITVVVLSYKEDFIPFVKMGFSKFVFDITDDRQITASLIITKESTVINIDGIFSTDKYNFNFKHKVYKYNNKGLYLTKGEQAYLYLWLVKGIKDNSKRFMLYDMRRKFGKDFLSDISKKGIEKNV